MYCTNCGTELFLNVKFCHNCGCKVEHAKKENMVLCENDKAGKTFHILDNCDIVFTQDVCNYIEIRYIFEKNVLTTYNTFKNYLNQDIKDIFSLYDSGMEKYQEILSDFVTIGVEILLVKGIDYITSSIFIKRYNEECAQTEGFIYLKKCMEELLKIETYANELHARRNFQRNTRSQWTGGGFGIKGAIKGTIKAELLNIGTNALRNIGDSITDSKDKEQIRNYAGQIFRTGNGKRFLATSLYYMICDIGCFTYDLLVEAGVYNQVELLSNEVLEAKVQNTMLLYKSGKYDKHEAINRLCRCIELSPFHLWPIRDIYKIDRSTKTILLELGEYLGIKKEIVNWMEKIDAGNY